MLKESLYKNNIEKSLAYFLSIIYNVDLDEDMLDYIGYYLTFNMDFDDYINLTKFLDNINFNDTKDILNNEENFKKNDFYKNIKTILDFTNEDDIREFASLNNMSKENTEILIKNLKILKNKIQ